MTDGPGYDFRTKNRPGNTWGEIKKDALNAYCAVLRHHNTPDAVVALYRDALQEASDAVQARCKEPWGYEWGHKLSKP